MLVSFRDLLVERREARRAAAGAFTCYDVTTAMGVVQAAEARRVPAILLVAEASFRAPAGRLLVPALLAVADEAARADVRPARPRLGRRAHRRRPGGGDRRRDGRRVETPASRRTSPSRPSVQRRAGAAGVEVELGHIEGGEDVAAATEAGALTDPDEAAHVRQRRPGATASRCRSETCTAATHRRPRSTGPASNGSAELVDVPLSLHGASGLPDEDLRRAVSLGISKVNVNAEIRERYLRLLADRLPSALDGLNVLELESALVDSIASVASEKLRLLGGRRT